MPAFKVTGNGRDSGRKRSRVYSAIDETRARVLADADGIVVVSVVQLPPEPPTERQLAYAKDLGISVPSGASKEEVSDLIGAQLQHDKPAAPHYLALARRHEVPVTQYTGKKALFDRLFTRLCEPGREKDMTAWFVFRVYRELVGGKPDASIKDPDALVIQDITGQLVQDAAVVKSIRRHQGRELIWFGEWTSTDGVLHNGGSNQTLAYKRTSALLREKLGAEVRTMTAARPRPSVERTRLTRRPVENTKGCLPVVVVGLAALLGICGVIVFEVTRWQ